MPTAVKLAKRLKMKQNPTRSKTGRSSKFSEFEPDEVSTTEMCVSPPKMLVAETWAKHLEETKTHTRSMTDETMSLGYSLIRNGRSMSNCSTKRTSSTQLHEPKSSFKHEPLGGSPIFSHSFGQLTHITHPHIILEGEVVPGIRQEELKTRRSELVHNVQISASQNNFKNKSHLFVIPSSAKKYMTEAIPYVFRQNSDFLYLTGCMEPDSILVVTSHGVGSQENILFLRGKNPHAELWDGPRTGTEQGVEFFGVDKCLSLDDFESFIISFVKEHTDSILWYDYVHDIHPKVHKFMKELLTHSGIKSWESPRPFIHKLRLFKSPAEQELMKKSCEIGSNAVKATIKNTKPGENEAHIFAKMDYECRINGAEYLAYPPVVAGGNRANIIHYINNNQIVHDGEMILMDAGCEYHGYSSDITRTWPVSGKFSGPQRILYEVVYSVQVELIKMCNDFPTMNYLFGSMCKLLGKRLQEAGVVSGIHDEKDLAKVGHAFCPHDVSHYLGMDVHDTSSVPRTIPLEPGMVFTIEPGIYVNANNKLVNPEFGGNGIRIEDDVLMTSSGPLVLTSSCPKHPDDIEALASKEK